MLDHLFLYLLRKDDKAFLDQFGGDIGAVDDPRQMEPQFGLMIEINRFKIHAEFPVVVMVS